MSKKKKRREVSPEIPQAAVNSEQEASKRSNRRKNILLIILTGGMILAVMCVWIYRLSMIYAITYTQDGSAAASDMDDFERTRTWDTETIQLAEPLEDALDSWKNSRLPEDVWVESEDGARLHGLLYPENSGVTVILLNYFSATCEDDFLEAAYYGEQGYNILIPEARVHGESGGEFTSFGLLESGDLLKWIDFVLERKGSDQQIVVHGKYAGAAAMLMAAGGMPDNVAVLIADSAYTSLDSAASHILKAEMMLPRFPIYTLACMFAEDFTGFSVSEVDVLAQMDQVRIPTIFVCDTADTYVLPEESQTLYEACAAETKELLRVDGQGFNDAYIYGQEAWEALVGSYLEQFLG